MINAEGIQTFIIGPMPYILSIMFIPTLLTVKFKGLKAGLLLLMAGTILCYYDLYFLFLMIGCMMTSAMGGSLGISLPFEIMFIVVNLSAFIWVMLIIIKASIKLIKVIKRGLSK